ncbi:MAG: hypothetical protein OEY86_00850 [Nitrospira sp.]|nr:hypothetical protein [Nitrospira sp.]
MTIQFGRRFAPDTRDRKFLLRKAAPIEPRPVRKTWRIWWKGDQGNTPMCVGYAWHALLRALPKLQRDPSPEIIYALAQRNDEWDGEDYDGSSVRGGAKALQLAGKIASYGWAFTVEDAIQWVGLRGPVVLGTHWYSGMMTPDKHGILRVTGRRIGGHAYELIGYDDRKECGLIQNSWGLPWALNGRAWIRYDDLDRLIREDGEACSPTE